MATPKVVLITGASRGLGAAMSLAFAKHGYAVALNFLKDEDRAAVAEQEIKKMGVSCRLFKADVRQSGQVNNMIENAVSWLGGITVLVNNAGIARNNRLARMTDDEWKDVLDVNLTGAFNCTRAVFPHMKKAAGGAIVNVVSYLAKRPAVGAANYVVSKAGLLALTQCAALETGSDNIRVNAVMPGFHVTDMNLSWFQRFEERIKGEHLLKKLPQKEDMAEFVVHIAEMPSVTGQLFPFESRLV